MAKTPVQTLAETLLSSIHIDDPELRGAVVDIARGDDDEPKNKPSSRKD